MRNRILEFSQSAARLSVRNRQLVIQRPDLPEHRVPVSDIAVIIVAHPQISYTQAVLSELAAFGGTFVTCNGSRMPIAMLLPLDAHCTQTQRFASQLVAPTPRKKRLWQQIVQAKIAMQSALLHRLFATDYGLAELIGQVKSGDSQNVEAWAAKRYWKALLGDNFRRDRDAPGINAVLNYGYAILRAVAARAICAAGLHPSMGLHHHNKYNSWCLADDLMEPYRPAVDRMAYQLQFNDEVTDLLEQETRHKILQCLTASILVCGERRSLFDSLALTSQSLATALEGKNRRIAVPSGLSDD